MDIEAGNKVMSTSEGKNYGAIKARKKIKMKVMGLVLLCCRMVRGKYKSKFYFNYGELKMLWDLQVDMSRW